MKLVNFFVKTSFFLLTVRRVQLREKLRFAANFTQFHTLQYARSVFFVLIFLLPLTGNAQVLVSEVAWMGTDEDANNEWIELYNLSGSETDLTGWSLTDDASISVTLTGTISPHGVAVLERTDDDTVPGTAIVIYTGALSNSGGTLTLRNAEGGIADEAVGGGGWLGIGGSNTVPKKTAQRTRTGTWVTGVPTPYADNVQENAPVVEDDTVEETATEAETVTMGATRSGGGSSSKKVATQKEKIEPKLSLTMSAPKVAYVNQEIEFEVVPSGVGKTVMSSLAYTWNFGDTYTGTGKKTKHTFKYPGEYVVIVHGAFAKQDATVRQEIKVLPVSFTLSRTSTGDILLKNGAPHEVDLAGFILRGTSAFTFPKFTIMKAGGTLTISKERVGSTAGVSLFDTQNVRVATDVVGTPEKKVVSPVSALFQNVSAQPLLNTETIEVVVNEVPKSQETIIQIGNTQEVTKEEGLTKRFLKRFASLFGF
jgi:hypothetical protein